MYDTNMGMDVILDKKFVSGHYESFLQDTFDRGKTVAASDLPSVVGSLAFCGRQSEALALYDSQIDQLGLSQKVVCRFFLGIGWVRQSQFKKAFRCFRTNQMDVKSETSAGSDFYVNQGIAFYLFYHGDYRRALKFARRAQHAAVSSQDLFSRILASDLIGHCQVAIGFLMEGFENLNKASTLAKNADNEGLSHAIALALALYEAQYGYHSLEIIDRLKLLAQASEYQDSYSYSDLHLELARQYCLRGRYNEALTAIDLATKFVLVAQNRRQEIVLYLRKAEVHYQRGEYLDALMLLQSARKSLVVEVDRAFELQILGLEMKCLKNSSDPRIYDMKKTELLQLSEKYNNHIHANIVRRTLKTEARVEGVIHTAEDKLGSFIDSVFRKTVDATLILRSGYLSFFYDYFHLARGKELILVLGKKSPVLFLSKQGIAKSEQLPTDLMLKVLLALSEQKEVPRQQFFESVWGLKYNRHRHDSLIYTTMSLVRKNMGDFSSWLQTTESGYQLRAEVLIEEESPYSENEVIEMSDEASELTEDGQSVEAAGVNIRHIMKAYGGYSLNFRQIKIIKYLQNHDYITTKMHMDANQITEISANRDLADLFRKKIVIRLGKARATKYILAGSTT